MAEKRLENDESDLMEPMALIGVDIVWDAAVDDPFDFTDVRDACGCYRVTRGKVTEHYACPAHYPARRALLQRLCVVTVADPTRFRMLFRSHEEHDA